MARFSQNTAMTLTARVLSLLIGVATSVALARLLGPTGRGAYSLAALLPSLIITFVNAGIAPSTVYYVARRQFPLRDVLGNNILLGIGIGTLGVVVGAVSILLGGEVLFPGVPRAYLILALALIPSELIFLYTENILLGMEQFKKYNAISLMRSSLFTILLLVSLLGLRAGVPGALTAALLSWLLATLVLLRWVKRLSGGATMRPNREYVKRLLSYGWKTQLGNLLGFLNYRVDMFLVNAFLGPSAVGFYAVGVGLVEKLWLVSQASSTVLFPRIAAEANDDRKNGLTAVVTRTVLWTTAAGAVALIFISRALVVILYSDEFLPAVGSLQALLVGIVALSGARVLANDIAGRGKPLLNTYVSVLTLVSNIALNLLWIPGHGIVGAAWASTVSYSVTFVARLILYCHLSGNCWTMVAFPQREDWVLYRRIIKELCDWARRKNKSS